MEQARQGDWVQIYDIVLPAGQRAPQVPAETQQVALEMRVKGFLLDERADLGSRVSIRTAAGRIISGELAAIKPRYPVDYGAPQPELLNIGRCLRAMLEVKGDA